MFFPLVLMLLQQLRATQPQYFFLVTLILLIAGGVGWLIAAVLGFARSPAFGPSARWFSYAAVCLIIYHLHFLLFVWPNLRPWPRRFAWREPWWN